MPEDQKQETSLAVASEFKPRVIDQGPVTLYPSEAELTVMTMISNAVAKSRKFPKDCTTAEEVLVRQLWGRELGLSPMVSIFDIHFYDGRPSLPALTMVAIVRRRNLGDISLIESTEDSATVEAWRSSDPTNKVRFSFSRIDAKNAELLGKGVWKKYPKAMLLARAQSTAARAMFQDVFSGVAQAIEDLDIVGDYDPTSGKFQLIDSMAQSGIKLKNQEPKTVAATVEPDRTPAATQPLDPASTPPPEADQAAAAPPTPAEIAVGHLRNLVQNGSGLNLGLNQTLYKAIRDKHPGKTEEVAGEVYSHLHDCLFLVWVAPKIAGLGEVGLANACSKRGVQNPYQLSADDARQMVNKILPNCTPYMLDEFEALVTGRPINKEKPTPGN